MSSGTDVNSGVGDGDGEGLGDGGADGEALGDGEGLGDGGADGEALGDGDVLTTGVGKFAGFPSRKDNPPSWKTRKTRPSKPITMAEPISQVT
jgi:hypothetical protein